MRAWKSWLLRYSITAFAACGCFAVASATLSCESVQSDEPADSIPVAQRALPEVSAVHSQKPHGSSFSSDVLATPGWRLEESLSSLGSRKPSGGSVTVSTTKDAKVIKSASQLPCDTSLGIVTSATTEGPDGDRKPNQKSPPTIDAVVQVKWNAVPHSLQSVKVNRTGLSFESEYCPFVLWDPSAPGEFLPDVILDSASIGSCSDLNFSKGTTGQFQSASVPRFVSRASSINSNNVQSDYLGELQRLRRDPVPRQDADAGETYLSELNQLLQGESNWLFSNSGLLDLAPEEGVVSDKTYLDELKGLVSHPETRSESASSIYRKTVSGRAVSAFRTQFSATQQDIRSRYSSIAPDSKCNVSEGSGISMLFEPLAKIHVNGLSTAPPAKGGGINSDESAELHRPENASCAYLDNSTPFYYFVPPRYGACRPPRGVHDFYHQPLYFEDPNLERCGRSHGYMTTAVSAAYFATAIAFTPYLTATNCPASCEKSLPDCPTCHSFGHDAYWPGWSWKGATAQAAAVTGLFFIVP